MYLKIYYRNGRLTDESDRKDIQQHIDALNLDGATIGYVLDHAAVEFTAGTTYQQTRELATRLQANGYETE